VRKGKKYCDSRCPIQLQAKRFLESQGWPIPNREKFAEWLAEGERVDGKAEVIIGKQRHGPTGTVELQFEAAVTRFANLESGQRPSFQGSAFTALPPPQPRS